LGGGSAGLTGSAGDFGAAVPASAAVRRFGGKLTRKSSISWENWHKLVGKDGGIVDQHQRQVSIGTKPQITQQIERSIQGQFGAIFWEKILDFFCVGEIGGIGGCGGQIRGNQGALDTI
jgi:hypothetical protein